MKRKSAEVQISKNRNKKDEIAQVTFHIYNGKSTRIYSTKFMF